jgi:hypothetical protein
MKKYSPHDLPAWQDGYRSGRAGNDRLDRPAYPTQSEREAFNKGWKRGDAERRLDEILAKL